MEDKAWLGIDVSKLRLDVVLVTASRQWPKAFPNDAAGWKAIIAWIAAVQPGSLHACMEATGRYGEGAATALSAAGHAVSVVNPFQIKSFGKLKLGRNKTDPVDALLIAEYCRLFVPPIWSPPSRQMKRLRELVRLREALKVAIVQWTNRTKAGEIDDLALPRGCQISCVSGDAGPILERKGRDDDARDQAGVIGRVAVRAF